MSDEKRSLASEEQSIFLQMTFVITNQRKVAKNVILKFGDENLFFAPIPIFQPLEMVD